MRLRMNRAIVGYILAGIAMLILLLYLRFPGEAVTDYVKAAAAARYPRLLLSIDTVQPSFPPGVTLVERHGRLSGPPGGDPPCGPPEHPARGAFPAAGAAIVPPGGGGIRRRGPGARRFSRLFSLQGPLTAEANIREIRIEKCAWLRDALARQITGTLKGAVSFSGAAEALKNGTGNIDFTLTNGTYPLLESFFGFERIDFSKVEGKISFRNGAMKITRLTLNGEKLRCSLKGNILLADDIRESRIDLNGTIEIPMQGNKRVTLAISGTLGNPKTRFM